MNELWYGQKGKLESTSRFQCHSQCFRLPETRVRFSETSTVTGKVGAPLHRSSVCQVVQRTYLGKCDLSNIDSKRKSSIQHFFFARLVYPVILRAHLIASVPVGGIQFYTQLKTVTSLWRSDDATELKASTAMPTMK